MFRVVVSPRAWRDFFEIIDYIRQDDPPAAQYFGDALLKHIELLAVFPHLGTAINRSGRVRKAIQTPIRIYYRIEEELKRVEIIHFWHASRRDPDL